MNRNPVQISVLSEMRYRSPAPFCAAREIARRKMRRRINAALILTGVIAAIWGLGVLGFVLTVDIMMPPEVMP